MAKTHDRNSLAVAGMAKEMRMLAYRAMTAGWTIKEAGSGHLKWFSPSGTMIVTSKTSKHHRAMLNDRALLKRAGLII